MRSARTAGPGARPVSASTPEGTSTATTGAPQPAIHSTAAAAGPRGAPLAPVPRRASTTTRPSAGSGRNGATAMPRLAAIAAMVAASGVPGGSPGATTCTSQPASARWRATTSPSPPLLPEPTTTRAARTAPNSASTASAVARPARSISRIEGIAWSSPARRSASRRAAESNSGVHPGSGAGVEDRAVGTAISSSQTGRPRHGPVKHA